MIKKITKNLQPALGITAGAVGAGILSKHIPVYDERVKAAILLVAGLALKGSGKAKGIVSNIGDGVIAGAGLKLVQSVMPGLAGIGVADAQFDVISGPWAKEVISGGEDLPGAELPQ